MINSQTHFLYPLCLFLFQSELRALSQRNADRSIEVANGIPPHQVTHTFSDHLSPGASQTRPKEPKQEIEVLQKIEDGKPRVGQSGTDPKTSSQSPTAKVPLAKMDSREPPKPPEKHVRYTPAVTVHRLPQGQVSNGGQQRSVHQGGVREHHGTQTSPLETPAPRRHAPRPHSKEIRSARLSNLGKLGQDNTTYKTKQKARRGLLNDYLNCL